MQRHLKMEKAWGTNTQKKDFFILITWTISEHFKYLSAQHMASWISNLQSAKSKVQSVYVMHSGGGGLEEEAWSEMHSAWYLVHAQCLILCGRCIVLSAWCRVHSQKYQRLRRRGSRRDGKQFGDHWRCQEEEGVRGRWDLEETNSGIRIFYFWISFMRYCLCAIVSPMTSFTPSPTFVVVF